MSGSGLAGPLLFWLDAGMSEVRKFEMLKVARATSRNLRMQAAIYVWFGVGFLGDLFLQGLTWKTLCVLGLACVALIHDQWAKSRPAKFLEMTEEKIRGPLGWRKWGEIPRDQVEEVVARTEGLVIAWKKNGVPWYTEVMEMWFSAEEWEKVRGALMEWGNRGRGGCAYF